MEFEDIIFVTSVTTVVKIYFKEQVEGCQGSPPHSQHHKDSSNVMNLNYKHCCHNKYTVTDSRTPCSGKTFHMRLQTQQLDTVLTPHVPEIVQHVSLTSLPPPSNLERTFLAL